MERNQQTHCANEKQVQGRAVEAKFHAVVRLGFLVSVPFKYFNFKGYLCRHPKSKDVAVQINFLIIQESRGFTED